jgi:hypothetical protein
MPANAQAGEVRESRSADPHWASAHPPAVGIVKNHDVTIGGQPKIALDARTNFECRRESQQTIFMQWPAMQSAMGEAGRARIEGIRL